MSFGHNPVVGKLFGSCSGVVFGVVWKLFESCLEVVRGALLDATHACKAQINI